MTTYPADHPRIPAPRIGVLLINLGTPDGTDYWSMRRYLSEFLSDQRVVELPKPLWQLILQGPILTFRPSKSGRAYRKIWNTALDESPLRTFTRSQTEAMAARFPAETVTVDYAMRYGQPSIPDRVQALMDAGCTRILCVPLYPQYSASTTGSVVDRLGESLRKMRWQPTLRVVPPFYDDPLYIQHLAAHVRRQIDALETPPEVLVASFHGVPKEYLMKGDPYHCQCQKTARLLREALGWPEAQYRVAFQSRFGPKEWLKPYADELITELGQSGVKQVAVVSPAFFSDCVETLEEIQIGLAETFEAAGGHTLTALACLNASDEGLAILEGLIRRELMGWYPADSTTQ
ncbi:MAG: ferrochelatase [Gammaproteobacteria bacterium]|nr:ferrochelatase [Gammaproteobacteria bacterium]